MLAAGEVYSSGSSTELPFTFAWPLPQGLSMIEAAAFGSGWNSEKSAVTLSLAGDFLRRVARYGLLLDSDRLLETAGAADEIDKLTPYQMIGRLASPRGSVLSARYPSFWKWAQERAGLLAAPESGLRPEDANELLSRLREAVGAHEQWVWLRRRLRIGRRERAVFAVAEPATQADSPNRVADFLNGLARQFPAYNWKIEIEIGTAEHLSAEFARRLKQYYSNTELLQRVLEADFIEISTEAARRMTDLFDSLFHSDFPMDMVKSLLDSKRINAYSQYDSLLIRDRLQEPGFDSSLDNDSTVPIITHTDGSYALTIPVISGRLVPRIVYLSLDKESRLLSGLRAILLSMKQLPGTSPWLKDRHAYFQGVLVRLPEGIEIPWPMPSWQTALSVQMFYLVWAELTYPIIESAGLPGYEVSWKLFICYIYSICQAGGVTLSGNSFSLLDTKDKDELRRWLVGLISNQVDISATEEVNISLFMTEQFILLASPESGLNSPLCKFICDIFVAEAGSADRLSSIETARLNRLVVATGSPDNAKEMLATYEVAGRSGRHPFQLMLDGWRKRSEQKTEAAPEAKKE
jgi:hypothetical protein